MIEFLKDCHMVILKFVPPRPEHARALLLWRYPPPYDIYDEPEVSVQEGENIVRFICDSFNGYSAMLDTQGALFGLCSYGYDAQVDGGDYAENLLDVGLGVKPDRSGQGMGAAVVRQILTNYHRQFQPRGFRATIAAFNRRSQRVFEKNGFQRTQMFQRADGMDFYVYTRGPLTMEELTTSLDGDASAS